MRTDDSEHRDRARSLRSAARVALMATAIFGIIGFGLLVFPVDYVQVNVDWNDATSTTARHYAEERRALIPLREDDPSVWFYLLADESRENVAALFATPGVDNVRFLDPTTFAPTAYQSTGLARWLDLRFGTRVSGLIRPLGLVPLFAGALLVALLARPDGRRWLMDRIPVARPVTLGVFRVALALALLPWILPPLPEGTPAMVLALRVASITCLGLFAVGAAARLSLLGFILTFGVAFSDEIGKHDFALPLKTLLLLCLVPWGAGFSVDEWVRRLLGRAPTPDVPSRRYGLGLWLPTMMLGLAYVSAAFAKIDQSGMQWITGGAARYFFIIDGPGAPGDLWRTIASSDVLSRVFSVAGLLVESLVIVAALWFTPLVVLAAGLAAASLHAGFWYFQGHWWPGWWALLTAFLPWEPVVTWVRGHLPGSAGIRTAAADAHVDRRSVISGANVSALTAAIVAIVFLQQFVVSFLSIERPPYVSSYPMYAEVNWESKESFVKTMYAEHYPKTPALRFEPEAGAGRDTFEGRLEQIDEDGAFKEAATAFIDGEDIDQGLQSRLRVVASKYQSRFGEPLPPVRVMTTGWRFEWSAAGFVPEDEWKAGPTIVLPPNPAP